MTAGSVRPAPPVRANEPCHHPDLRLAHAELPLGTVSRHAFVRRASRPYSAERRTRRWLLRWALLPESGPSARVRRPLRTALPNDNTESRAERVNEAAPNGISAIVNSKAVGGLLRRDVGDLNRRSGRVCNLLRSPHSAPERWLGACEERSTLVCRRVDVRRRMQRWCCASVRGRRSKPSNARRCCRCCPARGSGPATTTSVTAPPTCTPRWTSGRAGVLATWLRTTLGRRASPRTSCPCVGFGEQRGIPESVVRALTLRRARGIVTNARRGSPSPTSTAYAQCGLAKREGFDGNAELVHPGGIGLEVAPGLAVAPGPFHHPHQADVGGLVPRVQVQDALLVVDRLVDSACALGQSGQGVQHRDTGRSRLVTQRDGPVLVGVLVEEVPAVGVRRGRQTRLGRQHRLAGPVRGPRWPLS